MSKVLVNDTDLSGIASAIRQKTGGSTLYKPSEMAQAVSDIPTGITPTGTVNISQNGTVDVTQYASAAVTVPNSYAAGDEGKVVSNGALVAQGSQTITQNGTYDTTLISELIANIAGGGGGSTNILSGTDEPTASVGSDGDVYLKYGGTQVAGGYARTEYVVKTTSQRLSTHSAAFYKTVEGAAIAVEGHNGNWYCPILISDVADYAKYTNNTSVTEVVVDGKTWYVCGGSYANSSTDDPTIPSLTVSSWNSEATVRAILEVSQYTTISTSEIVGAYLKVNGTWQDLIGSDIDDVNIGN